MKERNGLTRTADTKRKHLNLRKWNKTVAWAEVLLVYCRTCRNQNHRGWKDCGGFRSQLLLEAELISLSGYLRRVQSSPLGQPPWKQCPNHTAPCSPEQSRGGSQAGFTAGLGDLQLTVFICYHQRYQLYRGIISPICLPAWVESCSLKGAISPGWAVPAGNGEELRSSLSLSPLHPETLTSRHHKLVLLKQHSICDHSPCLWAAASGLSGQFTHVTLVLKTSKIPTATRERRKPGVGHLLWTFPDTGESTAKVTMSAQPTGKASARPTPYETQENPTHGLKQMGNQTSLCCSQGKGFITVLSRPFKCTEANHVLQITST